MLVTLLNLQNYFFIFLPQAVHFVFSKNCGSPQRRFAQRIIRDAPHFSHWSPTKVWCLHVGQGTYSGLPQPAQTTWPLSISLMQVGQWYPNGLRL